MIADREWVEPLAQVLGNLGLERAWVFHGEGGLDEMTTTGTTYVAELKDGAVRSFEVTPEDAGLQRADLEQLLGGDPRRNAEAMRQLLAGEPSAFRDVVVYTAAGALVVADKVENLKDGARLAAEAIDSGEAQRRLDKMVEITNQ